MMGAVAPTEPAVHPSQRINNLNCKVERYTGCTRCHRLMHGCPRDPSLFYWEVDPEIGYRV